MLNYRPLRRVKAPPCHTMQCGAGSERVRPTGGFGIGCVLAERPTVVATHHAPHPDAVAARFSIDPLTPCFVSHLSDVIEARQPTLWIHGHTHDSFDYQGGATRVVCNLKGPWAHKAGATARERGLRDEDCGALKP